MNEVFVVSLLPKFQIHLKWGPFSDECKMLTTNCQSGATLYRMKLQEYKRAAVTL